MTYDPEHALQQSYAEPILLQWMASDPKPIEVPGEGGGKIYVVELPDGSVTTINEAQFAKLRGIAADIRCCTTSITWREMAGRSETSFFPGPLS